MKRRSAYAARERLQLMLNSDRMECSPQNWRHLREDLIKVTKKYFETDAEQISVNIDVKRAAEQGVKYVKTIQIKGL